MLQSLSVRDVVVSWPTRPTEANGWGWAHPYRFRCIVRHVGGNSTQATVLIRANIRAQRLTYIRGSRTTLGRKPIPAGFDSGSFREPVVRSGGAVRRRGVALRRIAFRAGEWLVAPVRPSPTKDAFSIGDSNRNRK